MVKYLFLLFILVFQIKPVLSSFKIPKNNAIWIQSAFMRGHYPSKPSHKVGKKELDELVENLKKTNVKYAYFFASPFDKEGNVPAYTMTKTAKQNLKYIQKKLPDMIVIPWVGGLIHKQIFLEDHQWVKTSLQSIKKMLEYLEFNSVHINFEYLLFGEAPSKELQFGKRFINYHQRLRRLLPTTYISSVIPATTSLVKAWKYQFTLKEILPIFPYVDQMSFIFFDTYIRDQKKFKAAMIQQLDDYRKIKMIAPNIKLNFGIGTHLNTFERVVPYRDLKIEAIPNHIKTLKDVIWNNKRFQTTPVFDGLAIFCDWQTSEEEWKQLETLW